MKKTAIIVAGGTGSRMNSEMPKQLIELNGLPILMHTINVFYNYDKQIEIIIVLPEDQINEWENLCEKHKFKIPHTIIKGGQTRFHSTQNAVKILTKNCLIAVHDGVRPLVSEDTLERCFSMAEKKGNAIPVIPIDESIRKIENEKNFPVIRDNYVKIQTPEVFISDILIEAFRQSYDESYTACNNVVEEIGIKINLVEGNRENIKITNQLDLIIAESLIKSKRNNDC
ncbi:2-C-methyl-D-erythritol 4-phosphate cytidylyltransferase [Bacteroidota bacterium]